MALLVLFGAIAVCGFLVLVIELSVSFDERRGTYGNARESHRNHN
jgi:hypothetical protein